MQFHLWKRNKIQCGKLCAAKVIGNAHRIALCSFDLSKLLHLSIQVDSAKKLIIINKQTKKKIFKKKTDLLNNHRRSLFYINYEVSTDTNVKP